MQVAVKKGIEWIETVGRNAHLGVDRLTHQFAIGIDTPAGRIPVHLTASDLERFGVEAIRLTGKYAVFDFSEPLPAPIGPAGLPKQAERPK